MKPGVQRLVHDIFAHGEDEISYDEASLLMARAADALLSNEEAQQQYPQLWQYLQIYPDGRVEYDLLMDLARADQAGQLQKARYIPPMPEASASGMWDQAVAALRQYFAGFAPLAAGSMRSGGVGEFAPSQVDFEQDGVSIDLEIQPSAEAGNWDLLCTISTAETDQDLEFASAWLIHSQGGYVLRETALSEMGDVTFAGVQPGIYSLRIMIGGQEYWIEDIRLPEIK